MKLTNQELIEEYFEQERHKYPSVSLEQFKEICPAPFKFLKQEMESGELPTVRLKYFGTFLVYPKRAKGALSSLTERFKLNKIDRTKYFQFKKMIDNFLNKHDESKGDN